MSRLQDPLVTAIQQALLVVPLDGNSIYPQDSILFEKAYDQAKKIYESEAGRGRSFKTILEHCILGATGEGIYAGLFRDLGLTVSLNNEKVTGQYWWDLQVEHFKIEVKFQRKHSAYLNFSHKKKAETASVNWQKWDLMLAWKTNVDETTFIPWLIIDHEAFNPDQNLYGDSKVQQDGTYLKVGVARDRKLLIEL